MMVDGILRKECYLSKRCHEKRVDQNINLTMDQKILDRVMDMWNSGFKLVWGLELALINKGRLLNPASALGQVSC